MRTDLPIKRSLISVSDKSGLMKLGVTIRHYGLEELISTGGTAKELRSTGWPVTEVSDLTGFVEAFDGRLKTLHPMVHGPLLFDRTNDKHASKARALGMKPIDLLVVNFYPFVQVIREPQTTFEQAIEQIDIGGPAMVRSAAKNYKSVVVLTDPGQYPLLSDELDRHQGRTTLDFRLKMAAEAFRTVARYDAAIDEYMFRMAHRVLA